MFSLLFACKPMWPCGPLLLLWSHRGALLGDVRLLRGLCGADHFLGRHHAAPKKAKLGRYRERERRERAETDGMHGTTFTGQQSYCNLSLALNFIELLFRNCPHLHVMCRSVDPHVFHFACRTFFGQSVDLREFPVAA